MNYLNRIAELQESLREKGLEGAVLFWSRDVFYYTGIAVPAWLAVRPDDWMLYIRSGYDFACQQAEIPQEKIKPLRKMDLLCQEMFPGDGEGNRVGTELDILPVNQARGYQAALGRRELVDISPIVLAQRAIKDADEVAMHKRAAEVAQIGAEAALKVLEPGITELRFAGAMEYAHRLQGSAGLPFFRQADTLMSLGPMSSGPDLTRHSGTVFTLSGVGASAALPAGPSWRVINQGDLVFSDIPPVIEGYHMDQGRMYCAGRAPAQAHEMHQALMEIEAYLMSGLRPGMAAGDAYAMAIEKATQLGMEDDYLRLGPKLKATFVGHSVGLEINEPPVMIKNSQAILKANMVLAIEQHFMDLKTGITVKLEDLVLLGDDGCELISVSPRRITEKI
jgi:Xaa-Pro dipeptidase